MGIPFKPPGEDVRQLAEESQLFTFIATTSMLLAAAASQNTDSLPDRAQVKETEDSPTDAPYAVSKELLTLCQPGEFTVHRTGQPGRTLYYQLFKPTQQSNRGRLPIVVWMHGHGNDELLFHNTGQLKYVKDLVFPDLSDPSRFPFYLLAVQCPKDEQWITPEESCDECQGNCDPAAVTILILEQLMRELPIDRDRVYLVGISSGGTASWEMAKRRPDLFAAVAPLASAGGGIHNLDLVTKVPIWAFHVTDDQKTSVEYDRSTISELLALGGNCALTETHGEPHDCWGAAFLHYELLKWLLSQRRGAPNSPPPGMTLSDGTRWRPLGRSVEALFEFWPQFCAIVVAAALYWIVRRELKRSAASTRTEIEVADAPAISEHRSDDE